MWVAWLNETCCYHFSGVLAVGTKEEVERYKDLNGSNIIDGYAISISQVNPERLEDFLDTDCEDGETILREGV